MREDSRVQWITAGVWLGRLGGALITLGAAVLAWNLVEGSSGSQDFWYLLGFFTPGATVGLLLIAVAQRLTQKTASAWLTPPGLLSILAVLLLAARAVWQPEVELIGSYGEDAFWASLGVLVGGFFVHPVALPLSVLLLLSTLPSNRLLGRPARWAVGLGVMAALAGVAFGLKWALDPPLPLIDRNPATETELSQFLNRALLPISFGLLLASATLSGHIERRRHVSFFLAALVLIGAAAHAIVFADRARSDQLYALLYGFTLPGAIALTMLLSARLLPLGLGGALVATLWLSCVVLSERFVTGATGEISRLVAFLFTMLQPVGFTILASLVLLGSYVNVSQAAYDKEPVQSPGP